MKTRQTAMSMWRAAGNKTNLDESVRWEIWGGEVEEIHEYYPCEKLRAYATKQLRSGK